MFPKTLHVEICIAKMKCDSLVDATNLTMTMYAKYIHGNLQFSAHHIQLQMQYFTREKGFKSTT